MSDNGGVFSRKEKLAEAAKTMREEKRKEQRLFERDLRANAASERRE